MTEQQKMDEIISLLTFLQRFIQNYVKQSFTDLTFNLEEIIKDYLNVFEKDNERYKNINFVQHNYPAVDLINKAKDVAVQVTTNADATKVKKTLNTYEKHNLSFSNLIVIGFIKNTKKVFSNVNVYGIEYLIKLVNFGDHNQKDKIYQILKRQIPWNSLNPLEDKKCFDIVFDVIDRSAVRDFSLCEGNYDKMVNGLYEIKEVITAGYIKGKDIRSKALVEYTESTKMRLSEIEFHVSEIIQICNANKNIRNSDLIFLDKKEKNDIDILKEKIINKTNKLSDDMNLNKKIIGSRRF